MNLSKTLRKGVTDMSPSSAKDAHEAMEKLDQIWAHPKEAEEIVKVP